VGKYEAAINAGVKDKVVLEVGTGAYAILAIMCARAGAKHVYAMEVCDFQGLCWCKLKTIVYSRNFR
jgi:predicted nicotinamide N-methyase